MQICAARSIAWTMPALGHARLFEVGQCYSEAQHKMELGWNTIQAIEDASHSGNSLSPWDWSADPWPEPGLLTGDAVDAVGFVNGP